MLTLGASWITSFRPFTTFHLVTAVVGLSVIAALCIAGRRRRHTPAEPRIRLVLAVLIIAEQVAAYSYWAAPSRFDVSWFLPLHPCRLMVWVSAAALLTSRRTPRALLYFWALSVCCQPILTPPRFDGLASPDFWFFWFSHLAIVGAALYDLTVRGFRPTNRDFAITAAYSLTYAAIVASLDTVFGWDYGYLGQGRYSNSNATDVLPPGLWRPIFLVFATALVMALLLLVWRLPLLWRRTPVATPVPGP